MSYSLRVWGIVILLQVLSTVHVTSAWVPLMPKKYGNHTALIKLLPSLRLLSLYLRLWMISDWILLWANPEWWQSSRRSWRNQIAQKSLLGEKNISAVIFAWWNLISDPLCKFTYSSSLQVGAVIGWNSRCTVWLKGINITSRWLSRRDEWVGNSLGKTSTWDKKPHLIN